MRAIIIDDSKAMRRVLGNIVEALGFEVLDAADGLEGLELLTATGQVELVLLNWNMPVMNGLEFVRKVRATQSIEKQKIVMVTTESEHTRMAEALLAGVDEFVMKPFTKEILIDKLRLIGVRIPDSTAV